ncbi:MAG: Hsp20/alpha crystallin family protein [Planctomycetota bacterium]|nr:MAG: Hsp20/alpha crystallin family protein [Planctomycetota bacterium]
MANETTATPAAPEVAERTRGGQVYRPNVDILETRDELTLVADVPGVKSDAIDIDFEDGVLTIQGKVEPRYGEKRNFVLREYGIGDFYRTFRVSEEIDASRIEAECAGGVLTVHLPKAEKAKPRKIAVKTA